VIGVPIAAGGLGGVDALYSTVQMPTGIPVATVAIDGAANAGYLAASILSLTDPDLVTRLASYRQSWNT
jgi:5-(carboxyamino)imidazole ribonucleotide mutase